MDHPDQRRLRAYLDNVIALIGVDAVPIGDPLAVELVVGLPSTAAPDAGGRDLDNYMLPIARRIGAGRIAAMFGRKRLQEGSTTAVDAAIPQAEPPAQPQLSVRTTTSAESSAWKQQIHEACDRLLSEPLPAGPVAVRIQFGVSSRRNWSTLWKPAIDALGPMLGMVNADHPFRPDDDRIVDLELHRNIDDSLGNDVVIGVWWQRLTI
jgi:hypothetical protein